MSFIDNEKQEAFRLMEKARNIKLPSDPSKPEQKVGPRLAREIAKFVCDELIKFDPSYADVKTFLALKNGSHN